MQIDHMNTIHECAPPFCGTFLISVGSINSSTKENPQCNGHADARNTKEEEVYHDLCAIHRASHSQVFFKTNFLSVEIFAIIIAFIFIVEYFYFAELLENEILEIE